MFSEIDVPAVAVVVRREGLSSWDTVLIPWSGFGFSSLVVLHYGSVYPGGSVCPGVCQVIRRDLKDKWVLGYIEFVGMG